MHLTALIEVTVSNFTYHFSTQSPCNTMCYIVQLVSVFLLRRSFSAARCWWPTRTTFISNTCSTRFKPFHLLINLSLTHGALSILSQHTTVNFHRFRSFCPMKPHYATLFVEGAILQRSVHVFALVAATRLKAQRCTAHGWTLTGIVNTAQCGSSSLSRLLRNLKIAFTFWFTLVSKNRCLRRHGTAIFVCPEYRDNFYYFLPPRMLQSVRRHSANALTDTINILAPELFFFYFSTPCI